VTAKLPGVLGEVASVAGEPAAYAIAECKGGTRIYIPAKVPAHHWLTLTVGDVAAEKIAQRLGGDRYDVPLVTSGAYRSWRRKIAKQVHDLDKEGKSSREIARTVGLTQRAIHRHRAVHRGGNKNDPQGSLF
jgi:hypothetical protein